ncbi:dehydrogenase [Sulfolobales archaeon HS-7]|nr:dehydrogenase [Sulfolobales archaeon HS-7]
MIACTRDCYDTCVFDQNYRPIRDFPFNGFTCSRGNSDLKRNDLNRVNNPVIEGKEVDLKTAVTYLVKELKKTKISEVIHVDYDGNQGLLTWYFPARLWNVLGAVTTDYSICSSEGHKALSMHYGTSFGALPEDFANQKAFVFWGSEASVSFIHGWFLAKDKYKVTIDVRISETARKSDRYFIIKPSSDAYLAVGIIKLLSKKFKIDDNLLNFVERFSMDQIVSITGLSEGEIEEIAGIYSEMSPLTVLGFALGRTLNGGEAIRLISLISHIIGKGRKGFFYSNTYGWGIDFDYLRGTHEHSPSRVVGMAEVGKEVEEGKLKFMFVWNSNPIHSLPGADRIVDAVREGGLFLVVHDPFWSETAKLANVVIPASTFLEKHDVVYSYWHQFLVYNAPIRQPKGVTEVELMREISKELGINERCLTEDEWDAIDYAIRNTGVTLTQLKEKGLAKMIPHYLEKFSITPLPEKLIPPEEKLLVYGGHPNYTNSQFKEIYGDREAVIYNSEYEGEGYLITEKGEVRVTFRKGNLPKGVFFAYKNFLFDKEGRPINSLSSWEKGKYGGTPLLNYTKIIGVRIEERKEEPKIVGDSL